MKRSKKIVLLAVAAGLVLPAIAGAQVTPFSFVVNDGEVEADMEFAVGSATMPHTFDLRSTIRLTEDDGEVFDPSQVGAKLTISQEGSDLYVLVMPAGSGWRVEEKRIRFDGDVAAMPGSTSTVALSVDFLLKEGTSFTGSVDGTDLEFNFEGDQADAEPVPCDDGVVMTKVELVVGLSGPTASADTGEIPADCD